MGKSPRGPWRSKMVAQHPDNQLWYRVGSTDTAIMAEQARYYELLDLQGRVVLDVGGHIGTFVHYAAFKGAAEVVSVEPEPCNFKLLEQNAEVTRAKYPSVVTLIRAAVVPSEASYDVVDLSVNESNDASIHSLFPRKGRSTVSVAARRFNDLVAQFQPSVLKMDIEGGELGLAEEILGLHDVDQMALELHMTDPGWREQARELAAGLASRYHTVREPRFTEQNWATVGVWQR